MSDTLRVSNIYAESAVGIGKTPAYALDVVGSINLTGSLLSNGSTFTTSQWTTTGSNVYYNTGSVGIGTNAISGQLHVYGTTTPTLVIGGASAANNQVQITYTQMAPGSSSNYGSLQMNNVGGILNWTANAMVGIGKTNPAYTLDVNGSVNVTGSFYVNGAAFSGSSQWTTSGSTINYTAGNVGIGTSPSAPLHVVASTANYGNNGTVQITNTNSNPSGCLTITSPNMTAGTNNEISFGQSATSYNMAWIAFNYIGAGSSSNYTEFSHWGTNNHPLVVTAGGNVGIGTTAPVSLLHVNGTATASQYNMSALSVGDSGLQGELTNILNLNLNVRGTVQSANAGGMFRIDGRNAPGGTELFQWIYKPAGGTSSSNIMSLDSSGVLSAAKIGISNSTPNAFLCVGPDGGVNGLGNLPGISMKSTSTSIKCLSIGQDNSHNAFFRWMYNATASNGYGSIQTYSGLNPLCLQDEGGYVGIGKTNPAFKLDVNGTVRFASPVATGLTYTSGSTSGYSISAEGTYGPFTIDPNFGSNNYVLIWDQLTVSGAFSATTKSFAIPHPVKNKRDQGLYLYHSCVETPNAGDTIERFQIIIDDTLQYTITMPDYYSQLCNNMMVMIQSVDTFGRSKYNITITDEVVQVHVNVSEAGTYNVMVMGTRCDKEVQRNNFQLEKVHESGVQQIIERCAKKQTECLYCSDCCPQEYV